MNLRFCFSVLQPVLLQIEEEKMDFFVLFCLFFLFLHLSHNGFSWQSGEVFCGPGCDLCLLQYIIVIWCMLKTLTTTSTQWHKMKKKGRCDWQHTVFNVVGRLALSKEGDVFTTQ